MRTASLNRRRVLVICGVVIAAILAVQWGEYSTLALMRQRERARTLQAAIDSLQHDIDSLSSLRRRVLTDPATQERIAREDFGMVRGNRELLYRFVDGDSSAPKSRP